LKQHLNENNDKDSKKEKDAQNVANKDLRYADIIFDMVEIGHPGSWTLSAAERFGVKKKINEALLPAMDPVRASLRGVLDLTADGLKTKYLNNNYVKNLIDPQTLETFQADAKRIEAQILKETTELNNDLNATPQKKQEYTDKIEALKQEIAKVKEKIITAENEIAKKKTDTKENFDKGIELTSRLLYDLIKYSMPNKVAEVAWSLPVIGAGRNYKTLLEAVKTFYQKFFDNNDLNETLLVSITQRVLKLIEDQNAA
jgi:polyhydroxyalkanoate synthesis regulator phasin